MFEKIKSAMDTVSTFLFGKINDDNTYCIPCKWIIQGKVYVEAPDVETAKAYVKTHKINPEFEDCVCFNTKPDTEGLILCTCGGCGAEYVISPKHNPHVCPSCGFGGEDDEL